MPRRWPPPTSPKTCGRVLTCRANTRTLPSSPPCGRRGSSSPIWKATSFRGGSLMTTTSIIRRARVRFPFALMIAAMAALVTVVSQPARPSEAGPTSPTTAIVSLGDSFISGEAGRWNGNSLNIFGTRDGTDRAARCTLGIFCSYDATRVYGSSYSNGCHRSDVATIKSAGISVSEKINLACSGARSVHIWRASQGGQSFKGEALQAELPAAMDGLRKSIDEVRAVMAAAGYSASQWKFVLAGYASPVPAAANVRYSGSDRWWTGGCPFYDADFDWAKNQAAPLMIDGMRAVAAEKGVQFLDVRDSLNGHEICHRNSSLVNGCCPNSVVHAWLRWVNTGCCQGDAQESVHPNAFGQRAIGRCVTLMYAKPSGNWTCNNTPGQNYNAMTLTAIP